MFTEEGFSVAARRWEQLHDPSLFHVMGLFFQGHFGSNDLTKGFQINFLLLIIRYVFLVCINALPSIK
jgi:hypothetical protein